MVFKQVLRHTQKLQINNEVEVFLLNQSSLFEYVRLVMTEEAIQPDMIILHFFALWSNNRVSAALNPLYNYLSVFVCLSPTTLTADFHRGELCSHYPKIAHKLKVKLYVKLITRGSERACCDNRLNICLKPYGD